MRRLALLLILVLLSSAGCFSAPGYRTRMVPGVTVVDEEYVEELGESRGTITIVRKELLTNWALMKILFQRAERGEYAYVANLRLQWIIRFVVHTPAPVMAAAYCEARIVPVRILGAGEVYRAHQKASANQQSRFHRPVNGRFAPSPWGLHLLDQRCKIGPPATHDQVTLVAEAY